MRRWYSMGVVSFKTGIERIIFFYKEVILKVHLHLRFSGGGWGGRTHFLSQPAPISPIKGYRLIPGGVVRDMPVTTNAPRGLYPWHSAEVPVLRRL